MYTYSYVHVNKNLYMCCNIRRLWIFYKMETFVETKFYHPSKARINDKTFKKIKLDEYYTTMDDDRVRWSLISEIPFYVQSLVFAVKRTHAWKFVVIRKGNDVRLRTVCVCQFLHILFTLKWFYVELTNIFRKDSVGNCISRLQVFQK